MVKGSFPVRLCLPSSQTFLPGMRNLPPPSCSRPINEAAKLTNWPLNWPLSLRALLPLAFSAPPSLAPAIRHHIPTLSQWFRVNPSDEKVLSPWTTPLPSPPDPPLSVSPSHSISVFYVCVTTSRWRARGWDDGVSSGLIPVLLWQTRLNSINRWWRRGGKRAKATGTWRNGIAEDGQTRLRDGRTASRLSPLLLLPILLADGLTDTHRRLAQTGTYMHIIHFLQTRRLRIRASGNWAAEIHSRWGHFMSSLPRNRCDPDGKEFDLTGTLHRPAHCTICLIFFCFIKGYIHWNASCVCLDLSACTGTNAQHADIIPAQSFHASIQVFKMLGDKKITAKYTADASSSCPVIFAHWIKLYCSSHHAVLCVFHMCSNRLSCSLVVYSLSSFTVEDTGCRYALV